MNQPTYLTTQLREATPYLRDAGWRETATLLTLAADEIEQLRKRILFLERASTPGMRPEDAVNARPFDTVFRVGRLRGLL